MTAETQSEARSTADEIFFVCGRNFFALRSAPDFSADGWPERRKSLSILLKISVLRCLLAKSQNPCEIFGKKTRNDFCAIVGRRTGKGVVVKTANSTRSCFDDERWLHVSQVSHGLFFRLRIYLRYVEASFAVKIYMRYARYVEAEKIEIRGAFIRCPSPCCGAPRWATGRSLRGTHGRSVHGRCSRGGGPRRTRWPCAASASSAPRPS